MRCFLARYAMMAETVVHAAVVLAEDVVETADVAADRGCRELTWELPG